MSVLLPCRNEMEGLRSRPHGEGDSSMTIERLTGINSSFDGSRKGPNMSWLGPVLIALVAFADILMVCHACFGGKKGGGGGGIEEYYESDEPSTRYVREQKLCMGVVPLVDENVFRILRVAQVLRGFLRLNGRGR